MLKYTVSDGQRGSLHQLFLNESAAAAGWGEVTISTRVNNGPWMDFTVVGFTADSTLDYRPEVPIKLDAKTDVDIKAKASAVGKNYHGEMFLTVIDD